MHEFIIHIELLRRCPTLRHCYPQSQTLHCPTIPAHLHHSGRPLSQVLDNTYSTLEQYRLLPRYDLHPRICLHTYPQAMGSTHPGGPLSQHEAGSGHRSWIQHRFRFDNLDMDPEYHLEAEFGLEEEN